MRLLALILLLPVSVAMSADYYCDPIKGDTKAGDGSAAKPWGTLESGKRTVKCILSHALV